MSTESDYAHFYRWIEQNGGQIHEHVKIDVNEVRGLFATETIESHAALAVIPRTLLVNTQHADVSAMNIDTERQALIAFLAREYAKQQESFWFPWIKLLNIDNEAEELLNIKMLLFSRVEHSTLGRALTARYQQLQQEYEQLSAGGILEASFEVFCAIDHLVWSRILDLPEGEPLSLVPFIDFANHSLNATARWFIDDAARHLILRSERVLNPGEEITICYGSKSNEELLYLYGFALPINPHDRVTLPVSLSPEDSLLEDKLHLLKELHLPPRLTLNADGHLTSDAHRLVKILSAQTHAEIDTEHEHYQPYLANLLTDYLDQLNMCSDADVLTKYYLDGQKAIIHKATGNLQ